MGNLIDFYLKKNKFSVNYLYFTGFINTSDLHLKGKILESK